MPPLPTVFNDKFLLQMTGNKRRPFMTKITSLLSKRYFL